MPSMFLTPSEVSLHRKIEIISNTGFDVLVDSIDLKYVDRTFIFRW